YLQSKLKFLDNKLTITPGVHSTYYDVTNKFYAEPRLSATYNFNDKIKLIGAWGHYYQFANRIIREDILAGSSDFWILSDDQKVPVSKAIHYITGINYETPDYLFSVEAYYKQLTGLSEYSLRFEPARKMQTINYEQNFFTGKGLARGIEFLAQKNLGT
ncbi:MAG: TonB-dependent receptor, partial [Flavobacteriaceae bacterium]|nr:TonB-dependent receptor [Flavobacteriaceae bacterium]